MIASEPQPGHHKEPCKILLQGSFAEKPPGWTQKSSEKAPIKTAQNNGNGAISVLRIKKGPYSNFLQPGYNCPGWKLPQILFIGYSKTVKMSTQGKPAFWSYQKQPCCENAWSSRFKKIALELNWPDFGTVKSPARMVWRWVLPQPARSAPGKHPSNPLPKQLCNMERGLADFLLQGLFWWE